MSRPNGNIVWSPTKGWHDGPPVTLVVVKPDAERARIAAQIHAAAKR